MKNILTIVSVGLVVGFYGVVNNSAFAGEVALPREDVLQKTVSVIKNIASAEEQSRLHTIEEKNVVGDVMVGNASVNTMSELLEEVFEKAISSDVLTYEEVLSKRLAEEEAIVVSWIGNRAFLCVKKWCILMNKVCA